MAPENEHEEEMAEEEDEGEDALETVSGAPWCDQLSALEEVPIWRKWVSICYGQVREL